MFLSKIILTQFKSYSSKSFSFSPSLNVVHGLNGVGKTNLLDAIYFLAMTKSYFNASDKQLIHEDMDFYRIEGQLVVDDEDVKLVVKYPRGKKKTMEKNGVAYEKLSEHIGMMPLVMIAPNDLRLIDALHVDRRRFVNATLSIIDRRYLEALVIYQRLLRQRNALLKKFQEESYFDPVLLQTYNERMNDPATYVHRTRRRFFSMFNDHVERHYTSLSDAREKVEIGYHSALEDRDFIEIMKASEAYDRVSGRSNAGPHKDKIDIKLDRRLARLYGSQGQKKSLVFALKLAQYDMIREALKIKPLLLLDDLFDKLDHRRVDQLLAIIIKGNFGQVFLTDTQLDRLEPLLMDLTGDFAEIKIDSAHA